MGIYILVVTIVLLSAVTAIAVIRAMKVERDLSKLIEIAEEQDEIIDDYAKATRKLNEKIKEYKEGSR